MPVRREEVDAGRGDVDGDRADRLDAVEAEDDAVLATEGSVDGVLLIDAALLLIPAAVARVGDDFGPARERALAIPI